MTKYAVYGSALDRSTRKPVKYKGKTQIRKEIIDTETNSLFKNCNTPAEVEKNYESFWNDLNPYSSEIVKVVGVKKIK